MSAPSLSLGPGTAERPGPTTPPAAQWFLGAAFLLLVIGLAILFSASSNRADLNTGDPFRFIRHQGFGVTLGVLALIVASRISPEFLIRCAIPFLVLTLALLIACYLPGLGVEKNSARRWLDLGLVTFQPSELVKVALPLGVAWSYRRFGRQGPDRKGGVVLRRLAELGVIGAFAALIALQPDYGTAIFIVAITGILLLLSGMPIRYPLLAVVAMSPIAVWLFRLRSAELSERIRGFLDPESVYQVKHSLYGIGSGGLTGKGFGLGMGAYQLPEEFTDFIFSVLAEETGFIGVLVVLGLYTLFLHSGWRVAQSCPDPAYRLLVMGVLLNVVLQALVNIAVATGSAPTKGIALPFFSYGSTHLTVLLFQVGLVVGIARRGPVSRGAT